MYIYPHIYRKLKRVPQVVLPKDIGTIVAYTCLSKDSIVVDAGTGSGWLALSLARLCKHVYSYDIREDFIEVAKKNKEILGIDNIDFKHGDVRKKIDEKNVDLVTLDFPGSEKALKNVKKVLKEGGYVVGYLPHMEQVKAFVAKLEALGFEEPYVVETIVRDFLVRKEGMRPTNKGIWHTAYLAFARKPHS